MRVYTCTPMDFAGDESFFSRESGMFARGLAEIGIEARAVMHGKSRPGDGELLIRTEYKNLFSKDWWKSLNLDGLVLYSWAAPRFTGVAQAVKAAGIPLMVCMDTCGLISPTANYREWTARVWDRVLYEHTWAQGKWKDIAKCVVEWIAEPTARRRMAHYQAATVVTVPTPAGVLWVAREAQKFGDADLAEKFRYQPHPQSQKFHYAGEPKKNLVITVARWELKDWGQKNPQVLVEAYRRFLDRRRDWEGMIVGAGASKLFKALGHAGVERLAMVDAVAPDRLPGILRQAKIGLWSSRWEGQQGTGAQALCSGCSVVSHSSPHMSCFRHYVTRESGRLASRNEPEALADELILEAESWDAGQRDPSQISSIWSEEFHAKNVARRALVLLRLAISGPASGF